MFAPSWPLLRTALDIRQSGREATEGEWRSYAASYLREMAASYRANRSCWDALLARPRVVLTCYCTKAERCHRRVLALVLERLGACYLGELPSDGEIQRTLFDMAMALDDE